MRHEHKTIRKSWIFRLYGSLMIGLFSLFITTGLSLAEDVSYGDKITTQTGYCVSTHARQKHEDVRCGDKITTQTVLTKNLDCSGYSESPALTIKEGGKLNLNGKKVIGNDKIDCVDITGDGARVWNGTVMKCKYGILIESDRNKIISVKVSDSDNRGILINGDENLLMECLVTHNGRQGIKINGGNRNKIFSNRVFENCRDGIEIEEGNYNSVFNNHVEDNGNEATCSDFGEDYKPWFYAGIDVLSVSENNKIYNNRACGNLGCDGSDNDQCTARERNFWDENMDDDYQCISTNEWKNNTVCPECTPNPANRNN